MLKLTPKNFNVFCNRMLYFGTTFCRSLAVSKPISNFKPKYQQILDCKDYSKAYAQYSTSSKKTKDLGPNMTLKVQPDNPKKKMVVFLAWMLAKEKHMKHYHEIYSKEGFDILTVYLTPKQMLFPVGGSQDVAKNLVEFLHDNQDYSNVVIHAFSVGAYLLGEVMLHMKTDNKYSEISTRIRGLVLDSPADIQNIPKGFPRAVSKNPLLVKFLEMYTLSHLWLLHDVATKHYKNSSNMFHNTLLECPALVLVSKDDIVGGPEAIGVVTDKWVKKGIDLKYKVWDHSKHVSHLYLHGDDYKAEVNQFLDKIKLLTQK